MNHIEAMKQEPVAWYRDEDGIRIYYETKVWDDCTPLYTTPQPKQKQGELVGYITNKRQRLNIELKPQTFVEIPTVTDWEIPLFTAPQTEQDEVDIRSRLYQRIHELEELLRDFAKAIEAKLKEKNT